ncbi:MAG: chemotaxis protein CheW [Myxococcota bacterium]|nr:chemotaxis protein CheW [Myxococcota bacterium]
MQRHRHDPSKNLVGFVVGDVEYAVAISRIREIANPLPLVALPHAPRSVVGVADYRGEVVAVVDLRARFGLPAAEATRRTKWLVVDVDGVGATHDEGSLHVAGAGRAPESSQRPGAMPSPSRRLVAMVVDAVTEVFGTAGAVLRPAPPLGGGEDVRGIAGVTTHDGGLVFVLDTTRLRDLAEALATDREIPSSEALGLPARTTP